MIFENATAATVGTPIFIPNEPIAEVPCAPLPSTALFSEKHCTWCSPTPLTGTCALCDACHCAGAPSTEHETRAAPDGPAFPVAVTYWVPAVDGASLGPENETEGCWLSTYSVLVSEAGTSAASAVLSVSGTAPCPYRVVSTG